MRVSMVRGRIGPRWLLVMGLTVVIVAAGVAWVTTRSSSATAEPTTSTVSSGTFKETVSATGTVEPAKQADLSFVVSGTVTKVLVAEGDKVKKGQVLARVDAALLNADVTAASSSLSAANTQLSADISAGSSDTQLAADHATVTSALSTLTSARSAASDARLRSTIKGTVASVDLAKGDQVSGSSTGSGSQAASGTTNATTSSQVSVISSNAYIVDATVASSDVDQVKKGLQAQITPTGVTDTVYGIVSSISLVATTSSSGAAEFPVTVAVTGHPKGLYAGSSADVSIIVKQETNVLTVPSAALHTSGSSTYVYKLVDGNRVKQTVEIGTAYGVATQVTKGLAVGDKVETPGFTRLSGPSGQTRTGQGGGLPEGFAPPSGGAFPGSRLGGG